MLRGRVVLRSGAGGGEWRGEVQGGEGNLMNAMIRYETIHKITIIGMGIWIGCLELAKLY